MSAFRRASARIGWPKGLVVMTLALVLVTGVVAAEEWVTPQRIGNPDAPTTITLGVEFSYSPQYDDPGRRAYLLQRFEEWTRRHPDTKVEFQIFAGENLEYHARLLEQAARGNAPDVAALDGMLAPLFFPYLQPLDQYITAQELDDWFDWTKDAAMIAPDGSLKTLWFVTNTVGLWYRKDLIPEPPRTWDEFLAVAKRVKEEHGFPFGFIARAAGEQIAYGVLLPSFYALGGRLVDENGKPCFGEEASMHALVETLEFWKTAVDQGATTSAILDISSTGGQLAYARNNDVALMIGGSWILSGLLELDNAELWDFTLFPQKSGVQPVQVVGGYALGVFTKDPVKQARAVDMLLHVFAGSEGMAGWCEAAAYSPTRKSVYDKFALFNADRYHQRFGEALAYGRARPGVETYTVMSQALQTAFQEVMLGIKSPEQAAQDAWKYVQLETM